MEAIRDYSDLEPVEQVEAILAVSRQPISSDLTLELAGVNFNNLAEEDRLLVESVLSLWQIADTDPPQYKVTPKEQETIVLEKLNVDIKSVNRRIAQELMKMIGFNL